MCASLAVDPAGKLDSVTAKSTVDAVMAPPASLVTWKVMVAFPAAPASALEMGGTSFPELNATLKTVFVVVGDVGDVGESLLHPEAARTVTHARIIVSLICFSPR